MEAAAKLREEYESINKDLREEVAEMRRRLNGYEDDIRKLREKAETAEERALRAEAHAEVCDERLGGALEENRSLRENLEALRKLLKQDGEP